jgi:alanyl aminopeptidase
MKTQRSFGAVLVSLAAVLVVAAEQPPDTPKLRLGDEAHPTAYSAELEVTPEQDTFAGRITIDLVLNQPSSRLWLNGHGLRVNNAYLEQGGRQIAAQPVIGGEEFLGFDFQQAAKAGNAKLVVSYSGVISERDFSGLFRRKEDGQWYAATQFEATWARRVFPSFDEPQFKVPWQLALHVKRELAAVSNTPAVSETAEADGKKCVRFAPTRPLPSYLVAFAVGPFQVIDLGRAGRKRTPIRIVTPAGRTNQAAFASQAIPPLLRRLEDYYGLAYPYEKLDHLAIPEFPVAMENAGLIIYGDTMLLAPPDRETIEFKRDCANVCTHEMAHQWFGDLVTMPWWDDVWLNESFATWISPKIVDDWKPEWRTSLDQLLSTFGSADADSLVNARCIRQPIETAADIDDAFDGITYGKGAAVLGMFESSLGEEVFRKAIQVYLKNHAYKNATTAEFLNALNQTARQDIGSAISSFLNQSGIPLVSVQPLGTSNGCQTVLLSQTRYLPVGSTGDSARYWNIPFRMGYVVGTKQAELGLALAKPRQTATFNTDRADFRWLLLDRGAAGYFISGYPRDWLNRLVDSETPHLSSAERMSVAHSISAVVASDDLPIAQGLQLEAKLLLDTERRVVQMAAGFLDMREKVPPDLAPNYHRFVQHSLKPLLVNTSWLPAKPETDDERLQRLALVTLAANAGEDPQLIKEAEHLASTWVNDRHAVPPDEAESLLGVAGRYADSALFAQLMSAAKKKQDPSDRQWLISALGSCKDTALAQQALKTITTRTFEPVDCLALLMALSSHIETRAFTYDYLKQHYDAMVAALPGDSLFWYLPNAAEGFDTVERQEDVESFFRDKDPKITGGPRIVSQVLERIHLNQAFKKAQVPGLIEFLKRQ